MTDDARQVDAGARWQKMKNESFRPAQLDADGHHVTAENRVAHALEYIAAQLGELNAKLGALSNLAK